MTTAIDRKRVLVIGGGIGGPAAGIALQLAGHTPVIYEAYVRPADDAGFFLNVASNGLDVLRTLGVRDAVLADACPAPRMIMWSGTGKQLGEVANGIALADGTVSVVVRRGQLQKTLAEQAVQRGIRIEYGKRLSAIEDTGAGVVCRFEDGTEAHGDVVLGADGLHSRARRFVDPMSPAPSYTGLLGVGGFAKAPALSPTLDTQHFVFGKRAFFGYLVKPSREVYWFANIAGPEPVPEQPARTTDEWKRELHTLFDGDGEIIHRILDAAVGAIGVHPVHDMPPLPTWRRGPVVLLGDAAHATSPSAGQGASQALEDAVVVAQCLRDIPDTATALATYERIRRERTERVVAYSRKLGSGKAPSGPVARWLRDLFLPFALKHFASPKAHAWLFTHHIDWDANIVTG